MRNEKHCVFIGRWSPLHKGHKHIIRQVHEEKNLPVLILVRDTEETIPLERRINIIELWLKEENIPGVVMEIPDIVGVYYGRDVGYEVKQVEVEDSLKLVSGTQTRKALEAGNDEAVLNNVLEGAPIADDATIKDRLKKLGYIE